MSDAERAYDEPSCPSATISECSRIHDRVWREQLSVPAGLLQLVHRGRDLNILQSDLIQLQTWSNKWQMEFNISKCVHLPMTNKTKPRLHSYSLCGVPLSTVSSHPYLGIKLYTKLTWANHMTDIASKTSKVLGMIKRTPGPCKPDVKETAYNMLV